MMRRGWWRLTAEGFSQMDGRQWNDGDGVRWMPIIDAGSHRQMELKRSGYPPNLIAQGGMLQQGRCKIDQIHRYGRL